MKNYLTIGIMIALQSGKRYTAKSLAEKFETSVKSIYRAIDILLSAGMPIVSVQGKNGGYEIIKESKINNSFFTMEELSSFISFIKSNPKSYKDSYNIDDRLASIADKNLLDNIHSLSQSLIIDTHLWGHHEKYNSIIDDIKNLIGMKHKLLIEYLNTVTQIYEKRIIHPYSLVLKLNSWYIYGYCETKKNFRLFKLSRINYYSEIKEIYKPIQIDILSKPWNNDFKNNFESVDIELTCSASLINEIAEWLGENIEINHLSNNEIIIKGKAFYSYGLIHKIMEFGKKIKILKPEKLKESLCNECLSIYNLYNKKSANL